MTFLQFLGSASQYPSPKRALNSLIINLDSEIWLFDCGEGTQSQFFKTGCDISKLSKIFISHMHGDHIYGLSSFIQKFSSVIQSNQMQINKDKKLSIFGPIGLKKYIETFIKMMGININFNLNIEEYQSNPEQVAVHQQLIKTKDINEITEFLENLLINPANFVPDKIESLSNNFHTCNIYIVPLFHSVPSFGYIFEFDELVLCLFGDCFRVETASISNSEIFKNDNNDNNHQKNINKKLYLVHESTLEDNLQDNAILKGHSCPKMASEVISQISGNGKNFESVTLILDHFSQRYKDKDNDLDSGNEINDGDGGDNDGKTCTNLLKEQAEGHLAKCGPNFSVIAAKDLLKISL